MSKISYDIYINYYFSSDGQENLVGREFLKVSLTLTTLIIIVACT